MEVADFLRRKDSGVGSEQHAAEMAKAKAAAGELEAQLAADETAVEALQEERDTLRYRAAMEGASVDVKAVEFRIAEAERRRDKRLKDLMRQRTYIERLQRPLYELQEREAAAELGALRSRQADLISAEAAALAGYWEARALALEWQREAREKTATVNRLRRRLGMAEVSAPALPTGDRLRPAPVMSGESTRPEDYRAAAARLRETLEVTEKKIEQAWQTRPRDRTVAQNDLVALHPPRGV